MSKMNQTISGIRRKSWGHIAAALFSVIIMAPIAAMIADSATPVVVIRTDMEPSKVAAGQGVRVTWVARELRACDGEVNRRFVDSAGVIFDVAPVPTVYRAQLESGARSFSREIHIPAGMALGPAEYGGTRRYWCNPLQRLFRGLFGIEIVLPVAPVKFTVVSR